MVTFTPAVKAAVKKIVSSVGESKFVAQTIQRPDGLITLNNYTGFSSAINTTNEIYAALPLLAQGAGDAQRTGDTVTPTRCYLDLNICSTAFNNAGSVDKTVHVFLMTCKSVKSLPNFSAIPITELLAIGNGTNGPFNGTSQAQTLPVNSKLFTVLAHKQFRMAKTYGLLNTAVLADAAYQVGPSFKRLRLNVKLPKVLKYSDDTDEYPTNSAPFLVIGYTRNDSSGDTAPTPVDTYVEGRVCMFYKDM